MSDDLGMAAPTGAGPSVQMPPPEPAEAGDKGSQWGFVVPSPGHSPEVAPLVRHGNAPPPSPHWFNYAEVQPLLGDVVPTAPGGSLWSGAHRPIRIVLRVKVL